MISINTTIEETSARIALLEQRRQAIQTELEAELGVQGLRAVLMAAAIPPSDRARLGQLLVQVARLVRDLREQGQPQRRAAGRRHRRGRSGRGRSLERLSGADNTYDPVKARRQQAAHARPREPRAGPEVDGPPGTSARRSGAAWRGCGVVALAGRLRDISAFFGLDMALRALQAQQTGIDVTSHNVANANTDGLQPPERDDHDDRAVRGRRA